MHTDDELEPRDSHVEYVGPLSHHIVVVDGWRVPFLTANLPRGGRVYLSLDSRFGLELTVAEAEQVVPFLAHCIAVALGYTCHPGFDGLPEPVTRHPFSRVHRIDEVAK